jgi:hypothetical protein
MLFIYRKGLIKGLQCFFLVRLEGLNNLDTISYMADIFVFCSVIGLKILFMVSRADFFGCNDSSTLHTL